MNDALLRSAHLNDIPQIKVLMEDSFGSFGRLEEMFTKWITQDQYSVKVALLNEKIVGVCTWYLKTDPDISKYEVFGDKAISFMKDQSTAWVLNLAINPEYRKMGLGKKLSFSQAAWLKEKNCNIVVGSSWVSGSNDNSQHLYLKGGFVKLGESREFLRAQMQNGAVCSVCKTSDCNCNSILFGINASDLIKFMENQSYG